MFAVRLTLLATLALAGPAFADLSARNAPAGMVSVDVDGGGRILEGGLPHMTSAAGAFRAGLEKINGYFDVSPNLIRVVRSRNGTVTMGVFTANLDGDSVTGLAISTYDPVGNLRIDVLFDTSDRLRETMPTMVTRMAEDDEEALDRVRPIGRGFDYAGWERVSNRVFLQRTTFPDGTASIGIAPGFTPQMMSQAAFMAASQDGAYIRLNTPISVVDPNDSVVRMGRGASGGPVPGQNVVAYDPDPVVSWKGYLNEAAEVAGGTDPNPQVLHSSPFRGGVPGWRGRLVNGTITIQGARFVFSGVIVESPPPGRDGKWTLQITLLAAPVDSAAVNMPALIAMQKSERVDRNAARGQTREWIGAINTHCIAWLAANKAADNAQERANFKRSIHNAKVAQDNIERSAAAFTRYINDADAVVSYGSGNHHSMENDWATALEKANPQDFRLVPVSEYKNGVNH